METLYRTVRNWGQRFIAPHAEASSAAVMKELRRRKMSKEKLCERCGGSGMYNWTICRVCLGQATTLSNDEWFIVIKRFYGDREYIRKNG